jgi:histidinol-phosphate/aromatic aminotransferase/cobyric acid decarboxylase-like protein
VSVWLSLGVLLAIAAVLIVALPFLRRPGLSAAEDSLGEPDELERRRLELAEERDRALAALKELEFDHRTGKVSDEDYRVLVGPLRRRAAEALRALEPRSREAEAEERVRAPG